MKTRVHYTISQKLCGEVKRVTITGNSPLHCNTILATCFRGGHWIIKETFREEISPFIQDETGEIVEAKSGIQGDGIVGAALSDNLFQNQNS